MKANDFRKTKQYRDMCDCRKLGASTAELMRKFSVAFEKAKVVADDYPLREEQRNLTYGGKRDPKKKEKRYCSVCGRQFVIYAYKKSTTCGKRECVSANRARGIENVVEQINKDKEPPPVPTLIGGYAPAPPPKPKPKPELDDDDTEQE
jgi:hypothetical protein